MNPNIIVDIFPLSDPVGKAVHDTEIEACILTREVEKGGQMVNDARKENGLSELDLVFVNMILVEENNDDHENKFSNKTSSTYIREYIAKKEDLDRQNAGRSTKNDNQ